MICKDIIMKLTNYCIVKSRVLQNVNLIIIVYDIINTFLMFLYIECKSAESLT